MRFDKIYSTIFCWQQCCMKTAALFAVSFLILSPHAKPLLAAPTISQPSNGSIPKVRQSLSQRGDLTLRSSSLEAALFTISELWKINIVAGGIEGTVNGVFKDAPLQEILDSILLSNGYGYRQVGESLVVSELSQLGQINPFFVSETIPVGAADVNEVVGAAQLMSTPQGRIQALPMAGALLVVDFADRVEKIRALVQQIDAATRGVGSAGGSLAPRKLEVAYFRTQYVPALQASTALNVVLSTEGRIAAMENEDRILVVDYEENIQMVESVLARLDRPRPQVNIKALIYDISLSDIEEIGINWNVLSSGAVDDAGLPLSGSGIAVDSVTKSPFDAASAGSSFTFFSLESDFNLSAVALALQQATDSRLLASPNVTVLDNEQANIESISEIPFQQLTQTGAGGQIGTTAFKEAGIKLGVLPKISRDNTINMIVTPEFSSLVGFTPGDNQPIIDTRRATTRVRVGNKQTLMIAGLRQRNDVGDFNGIPHLKDVRFLGHLFRARETQITESELVVFLEPEIVGTTGPHGERDCLTADTVRCRLDHIPAAEGCPPGCVAGCNSNYCEACNSGTSQYAPQYGPSGQQVEVMVTPQTEAEPQQVLPEMILPMRQEELTPTLVSPPLPTSQPTSQVPMARQLRLNYPELSKGNSSLRRLPNINDENDEQVTESLPDNAVATNESKFKSSDPMRIDYDSRFRAKGDVNRKPEKVAEKTEATEQAPKSWTDRLFFR